MSCEIIQFSARLSAKRLDEISASASAIVASVHHVPTGPIFVRRERPLAALLTETCNSGLRAAASGGVPAG